MILGAGRDIGEPHLARPERGLASRASPLDPKRRGVLAARHLPDDGVKDFSRLTSPRMNRRTDGGMFGSG
jgi:hypothetical protein